MKCTKAPVNNCDQVGVVKVFVRQHCQHSYHHLGEFWHNCYTFELVRDGNLDIVIRIFMGTLHCYAEHFPIMLTTVMARRRYRVGCAEEAILTFLPDLPSPASMACRPEYGHCTTVKWREYTSIHHEA